MNYKLKFGFTLIEILVAIGILAIIAVVGSNMFLTILKSTTKTKVLTEVKQEGDFALQVMERMIRNAQKITSDCSEGMTSITIKNPDNEETIFACEADKISSNSASLTSDQVVPVACRFDCLIGQEDVMPDQVTIGFSLEQAGTGVRQEEKATVNFETTVTLRNY